MHNKREEETIEIEQGAHVQTGMRVFGTIIFGIVVFLAGVYVGFENRPSVQKVTGLFNKETAIAAETDFNPFWKAWQAVDEKFPGASDTSNADRMYGAIKGMLASFDDPYTTFFTPSENTIFETEINGEFSGVGIELGEKDGILTVIAPLKNTPADKAGILPGDKIVKIADTITTNMSIDDAIDLIRGENGTAIALTIFREGFTEPKVYELIRSTIVLPTVETETIDGVFVIHLYNFSAQSVGQFKTALQEYAASGNTKLLLDLRGNPGGYLDAAVSIGSWFIPSGQVIVKEIGKTESDTILHTSAGPVLFPANNKLVVLVDKGSASASEILAGALSEHGIGQLVGTQTYGKGSVQEVIPITSDTSMKVTVAKWYTPKGVSISDHGLTPSVVIPYNPESTVDTQLQAAIDLFK
ncbi:MAG TPA: S41 family peptidase [Candidatus Paceibacterota bacterium]